MNVMRVGFLMLLAVFLTACSSQPSVVTDHDTGYNFSQLRTFAVSETRQENDKSVLISPFTISHLHRLIETELGQRYQLLTTEQEPDFLVSYHIVLEERLEIRSYDQRYGFGYYGYPYRPYPFYYQSATPAPRIFRQGTLIIDIVDAKAKEPIWRGVSEQRLRDGMTPQEQRELLSNVVTDILSQFPPVR